MYYGVLRPNRFRYGEAGEAEDMAVSCPFCINASPLALKRFYDILEEIDGNVTEQKQKRGISGRSLPCLMGRLEKIDPLVCRINISLDCLSRYFFFILLPFFFRFKERNLDVSYYISTKLLVNLIINIIIYR